MFFCQDGSIYHILSQRCIEAVANAFNNGRPGPLLRPCSDTDNQKWYFQERKWSPRLHKSFNSQMNDSIVFSYFQRTTVTKKSNRFFIWKWDLNVLYIDYRIFSVGMISWRLCTIFFTEGSLTLIIMPQIYIYIKKL